MNGRNGAAASNSGSAAESLLIDMAWTAGVGRSHFAHRAGVVFHDAKSLEAGLRTVAEAERDPRGGREPAKTAFVYAESGSPAAAVGKDLYQDEPVVRALIDRCDAIFRKERGESLIDEMFGASEAGSVPGIRQALLFSARSPRCGRVWEFGQA